MNNITAKDRIQRDLQGDLLDDNHATRRYFRCWLDGSYLGEDHYRSNVEFIKSNSHDRKAMRRFIIGEFVKYTAHDAHCSASYAQKVIVDRFSKEYLNILTDALIDDAIEFALDHSYAIYLGSSHKGAA